MRKVAGCLDAARRVDAVRRDRPDADAAVYEQLASRSGGREGRRPAGGDADALVRGGDAILGREDGVAEAGLPAAALEKLFTLADDATGRLRFMSARPSRSSRC